MRLKYYYILIFIVLLSASASGAKQTKVLLLMGSRFEITAIAETDEKVNLGVEAGIAEIQRIENLISSFVDDSQTALINENAGISPVNVDRELYDLIYRSLKVSRLTNGCFDISWASMDRIWYFDTAMKVLPLKEKINQSVALVNYEDIVLNKELQTVFLAKKGMKISFGALGKGYAANKARDAMKSVGIENGIVIAGGDLISWGADEGKPWVIGVADPQHKEKVLSWLEIGEMAVVTSGNYEKFVLIDGERYSHIIDPNTGYPVRGLKSVTIICSDAELADALATSVFIMGREKGLAMINKMKGVEALLVTDQMELIASDNLQLNYYRSQQKQKEHSITIK